jgi:hypothetical protein
VLYNLKSDEMRVLDSVGGHGAYAEPGLLNGRYAVWAGCPDNFCTIYRYDIRTGTQKRIASNYGQVLFGPSVASNGDVYYGRGGRSCGSEVKLMRYRPGSGSRVVRSLPAGYDFRFTTTTQIGDRQRVFFDGGHCPRGFDIFAIRA